MRDTTTLAFTIPDMTCGHCAKTITGAVLSAYPDAKIDIDLTSKRASIKNGGGRAALLSVIEAEGYSPVEAA